LVLCLCVPSSVLNNLCRFTGQLGDDGRTLVLVMCDNAVNISYMAKDRAEASSWHSHLSELISVSQHQKNRVMTAR
jgi:hypothetical protein